MKFIDLSLQAHPYHEEIATAISSVLTSGQYIDGPEVEQFEQEFAAYIGVKHVISCNSGTDALMFAVKALDIGPGDEVIVPSFTYVATASVVAHAGATPVFCDVDQQTFNIDPASFESKITENTKAVIPVHLFGQSADMDAISNICQKHNIKIIEDCAQSTGATWNGVQTGAIGDIGTFSFFPTKNLGCFGDGGAMTTNDDKLAHTLRTLKSQGRKSKYNHIMLGYNSRLDAIQAAILRVKLRHLDTEIAKRQAQAKKYAELLTEATLPYTNPNAVHTYNQYTIKVKDQTSYIDEMKKQGIPTAVYYPLPLHEQPCFEYLGYKPEDLPVSHNLCSQVVSLPILT